MRTTQTIYEHLKPDTFEKEEVERFDAIYSILSAEAQAKMIKYINILRQNCPYLGVKGAKYLLIHLYDFMNMDEKEQAAARKLGTQLLSIQ